RGFAMDWIPFSKLNFAFIIHYIPGDVKNPAKHAFTHRHADWAAGIRHAHAALQTLGRRHCYRANPVLTKMLLYFECQLCGITTDIEFDFERVVDPRQLGGFSEVHVHDGTNYLNNISFIHK